MNYLGNEWKQGPAEQAKKFYQPHEKQQLNGHTRDAVEEGV